MKQAVLTDARGCRQKELMYKAIQRICIAAILKKL